MKQKNKYDSFIEDLVTRFSNIPNFNLTQEDESGRRLFQFVVKRILELYSFKVLFLNHYIPQSSKAIVDDLKELKKSKYNQYIILTQDEIHENYYETIRLGYVGLFHKYENFINDLIHQAELFLRDEWQISESFSNYLKREFNYDLKDWKSSTFVHRINWICNCVKHKDGYPIKPDKPVSLTHLPENEKIKLAKDELKSDIGFLEQHYTIMLSLVLTIVMYRSQLDNDINDDIQAESRLKAKQLILDLIDKLA